MTTLKKILLSMLVICTLGYGSAWAYDGHAVNMDAQSVFAGNAISLAQDVAIQSTGNQNGDQNSEQHHAVKASCCDHCGHISAHLQAIFTQASHLCTINQSSELLEYSETSLSYIVSPDLRPPRV